MTFEEVIVGLLEAIDRMTPKQRREWEEEHFVTHESDFGQFTLLKTPWLNQFSR